MIAQEISDKLSSLIEKANQAGKSFGDYINSAEGKVQVQGSVVMIAATTKYIEILWHAGSLQNPVGSQTVAFYTAVTAGTLAFAAINSSTTGIGGAYKVIQNMPEFLGNLNITTDKIIKTMKELGVSTLGLDFSCINDPSNMKLATKDHIDGQYVMNQIEGHSGIGGAAQDPKMWAEREKAIREHIPSKNNEDVTEEYYKQAKILLEKEGGWSLNMDTKIAQNMLKQEYGEKKVMDAIKTISPCVPGVLSEGAQSYAKNAIDTARKLPDVNSIAQTTSPTKICNLRKTLNDQIQETNKQLTELNQQRDQVKGDLLNKEEAEKLAVSDLLNGRDKQLDKQAQELQAKQDKLKQYEKDTIVFGKEHGLDTTLWRHAPEFLKGDGLKNYESSMATIEHNKQVFDKQAADIQVKRDQLQEKLQTPESKSEIAKKAEEILVQDKERFAKLETLDRKINELTNEKNDIIALKNIIPSRKLDNEINIQGDAKDVKKLMEQTNQIKQQVADLQQSQVQRGRSI